MKHLAKELIVSAWPQGSSSPESTRPPRTEWTRRQAGERLDKNRKRLSVLQYLLYAEARRSLLVVLQGIDAGGKDGTIRHVMSGLNPQGVHRHVLQGAGRRRETARLSLARAQGRAGIGQDRNLQPLAL